MPSHHLMVSTCLSYHQHAPYLAASAGVLTLIFPVAALHLLMHPLLHFSLEYPCSCGLVEAGCFEDMGCIDVVVCSTSHDLVVIVGKLVDGDLCGTSLADRVHVKGRRASHGYTSPNRSYSVRIPVVVAFWTGKRGRWGGGAVDLRGCAIMRGWGSFFTQLSYKDHQG